MRESTKKWVARCTVSSVAFAAAGAVAALGQPGWGWFIAAGLLCLPLYQFGGAT